MQSIAAQYSTARNLPGARSVGDLVRRLPREAEYRKWEWVDDVGNKWHVHAHYADPIAPMTVRNSYMISNSYRGWTYRVRVQPAWKLSKWFMDEMGVFYKESTLIKPESYL